MDNQDEPEFMDDDSGDANSPAADPTTFEETSTGASAMEPDITPARTMGQPLSDFLMTLEDYTPTVSVIVKLSFTSTSNSLFLYCQIPDAVTCSYLASAGFEASDPRM